MTAGAWIAIAVLLAATAFGLWRRRMDGYFRDAARPAAQTPPVEESPAEGHLPSAETGDWGQDDHNPHARVSTTLGEALPAESYGERATLVQFSSAFCAPCRVARRVLGEVAEVVPGVTHVEVDAESHLEVVRALGILRTPTTVVVDAAGREVSRAVGAPRKEQVLAALDQAV
jgi:thiol-disulfide isomerase/thioredoxin